MNVIANDVGISEPHLRLLVSLFAAYPIASIQRKLITLKFATPFIRNLFNLVSGLAVAYFFCGQDIVHSWFTITATWAMCKLGSAFVHPKSWWLIQAVCFVFNFAYLLISYWFHASDSYDINFTTPQSVLTLRLIGFAFDFADSSMSFIEPHPHSPLNSSSRSSTPGVPDSGTEMVPADQHKPTATVSPPVTRIETESNRVPTAWSGAICFSSHFPGYLETLGFAYYSGSFLVGPQFSFSLYRKYLTLDLFKSHVPVGSRKSVPVNRPISDILKSSKSNAILTLIVAVVYLGITQVMSAVFPSGYTLLPEFQSASFLYRFWYSWIAGKTVLSKYLGVWILTEGACILSGLSFDGIDGAGEIRWSGLANINIFLYEFSTSLAQIVTSFNINTNHWARLYLYKRLRFLGNKHLSSVGTLGFLALWHGFHAGYIFAFSLEFVDMIVERRLKNACAHLVADLSKSNSGLVLVNLSCWLLTTTALYYSALGFDLLTSERIFSAFSSLHWYGHWALVVCFGITLVYPGRRSSKPVPAPKKVQ